jgi:hypothetical protein
MKTTLFRVLLSVVLVFAGTSALAQPANDNFANAISITLASNTVPGSNVGATKEPGEPTPTDTGGASVWWNWLAPASGVMNINTIGSSFDTILGVYTGSAVNSLTLVAANDDYGGQHTSLVTFSAVVGTTYQIVVDGYGGATGSIVVTVDALPSITSPTTAAGTVGIPFSYTMAARNGAAGFKANGLPPNLVLDSPSGVISGLPAVGGSFPVPLTATNAFGTSTTNLQLNIDTMPVITSATTASGTVGASFAYTITAVNSPTSFGVSGLPSPLSLDSSSGVISGIPADNGIFNVTLSATNATGSTTSPLTLDLRPANDDFANAIAIIGTNRVFASNPGATLETGEPAHDGKPSGASVWWTWTAATNGTVTVDTIGSSFDTLLAIYTGSAVNALTGIAADDDSGGNATSLVTFAAVAGTTYNIAVAGFGSATGNITLTVRALSYISSPTTAVGTLGLPFNYTTTAINAPTGFGATGLPSGLGIDPATGIISGTPGASGPFAVTLFATNNFGTASTNLALTVNTLPVITSATAATGKVGISFNFALAALNNPTGFGAAGLPGGLNLDAPSGQISGIPTTNGIFPVAVTATNASGFTANLLTITVRPANDNFADAIPIVGTNRMLASNVAASREAGEPNNAGKPGGASLWWSWTAPVSGSVQINTVGSSFDTTLGVYTGTAVGSLTTIAGDDDSGGNNTSLVNISAVAGTTYQISVDGYGGATGQIVLSVYALPLITSSTSAGGTVGLPFNYTITAINSPTGFNATGLPGTLSVNATSGLISGTPAAGGLFPVTLFATNGAGTASTNLTLTIDTMPVITSPTSATGQVGVPFSFQIAALNSPGSFNAMPLPAGLSVNTNTGLISGTPAANGVFGVTLFATNSTGTRSGPLTLDIRPVNDDFADRIPITLALPTVTGSNPGATKEAGEPNHGNNAGGASVWWTWVANASGAININTIGSSFDTTLGVYTGSAVNGLTLVANDDDYGGHNTSLVFINAVAGTAYQIAVDGYGGGTGNIVLTVDALATITSSNTATAFRNQPFTFTITAENNPTGFAASGLPSGLNCSPAGVISGATASLGSFPVLLTSTNAFGTSTNLLQLSVVPLPAPVITSANTAVVLVNSPFNYSITALYFPTAFGAAGLPPGLNLDSPSGVISGSPTANGNFTVTLFATNGSGVGAGLLLLDVRPANDDFASRITIASPGIINGSNPGATSEPGEPNHAGVSPHRSVWWTWTSSTNAGVDLSTVGSSFDTILAVYTGASVSALSPVASNDDSGGATTSRVLFNAAANTPYQIAVDGYGGDAGSIVLHLTVSAPFVQINSPPSLTPITDRTINPGSLLTFTNTATDPDGASQTLAYSLVSGAPAGATVNPATGVFTWQPSGGQANTTNQVGVVVTDNGTPPLSDSKKFNVIVNPLSPINLTPLSSQSRPFQFQLTTDPGVIYTLQFATNLNLPVAWNTLLVTNASVTPIQVTDTNATNSQRYYRAVVAP